MNTSDIQSNAVDVKLQQCLVELCLMRLRIPCVMAYINASLFLRFSLKCKRKPHFEDSSLLAMTVQWYFITKKTLLRDARYKPVFANCPTDPL